jgi:hypothetical protein
MLIIIYYNNAIILYKDASDAISIEVTKQLNFNADNELKSAYDYLFKYSILEPQNESIKTILSQITKNLNLKKLLFD